MKLVLEKRYQASTSLEALPTQLDIVWGSDEGFLQEDECSPYRYYISKENQFSHTEKALFYNALAVPDLWEIRACGIDGAIYNDGIKCAHIRFAQPIELRSVQTVEWITQNGWVYKKDFYDKFGIKYISEFFAEDGTLESRSFYSDTNKIVLTEYPQHETIALSQSGKKSRIFYSYREFILFYLEEINEESSL